MHSEPRSPRHHHAQCPPETASHTDTIKGGHPGLAAFQLQGYKVRLMGNNASSSFLTFLNNAFVHKPEVLILKSIVLIVLFGKINEKPGGKKWDLGFTNTERGVGTRLLLSCRMGLAAKTSGGCYGRRELLTLQKCTRQMWATQLSPITLRRPRASIPIPGKLGPSSHGRVSKSQRSNVKSRFSHLLAVWPWEGHAMSSL